MYRPVATSEIIERVEHIRDLFRQRKPGITPERSSYEKREQRLKDLVSNLRRTNSRAMVQTLYDLETLCSLTRDGAYRLFGYSLDALREWDPLLNGTRTHIIEGYIYERDYPVELPLELAPALAFRSDNLLGQLVLQWQRELPIRVLQRVGWRRPGIFYVHIGTEDSLGSSIPPGATALVETISREEASQPNPRHVYLLQFRNGYRCCRCVLTRGRLQLFNNERMYAGPQELPYPSSLIRIVGRVKSFAVSLPLTSSPDLRSLASFEGDADLVLPWEHPSRSALFGTKYRRFIRSVSETHQVRDHLQRELHTKLSERTRQRYRSSTVSEPHADVLMQLTVESMARFSDTMRLGGFRLQDSNRVSLDRMLESNDISELQKPLREATTPEPIAVWDQQVQEIGEYSALFAMRFPHPSALANRVVRLGNGVALGGEETRLGSGSWLLMENVTVLPDLDETNRRSGWSRPLYALRRGFETIFGHIERDGSRLRLLPSVDTSGPPTVFSLHEFDRLHRVSGAVVPV